MKGQVLDIPDSQPFGAFIARVKGTRLITGHRSLLIAH